MPTLKTKKNKEATISPRTPYPAIAFYNYYKQYKKTDKQLEKIIDLARAQKAIICRKPVKERNHTAMQTLNNMEDAAIQRRVELCE